MNLQTKRLLCKCYMVLDTKKLTLYTQHHMQDRLRNLSKAYSFSKFDCNLLVQVSLNCLLSLVYPSRLKKKFEVLIESLDNLLRLLMIQYPKRCS